MYGLSRRRAFLKIVSKFSSWEAMQSESPKMSLSHTWKWKRLAPSVSRGSSTSMHMRQLKFPLPPVARQCTSVSMWWPLPTQARQNMSLMAVSGSPLGMFRQDHTTRRSWNFALGGGAILSSGYFLASFTSNISSHILMSPCGCWEQGLHRLRCSTGFLIPVKL